VHICAYRGRHRLFIVGGQQRAAFDRSALVSVAEVRGPHEIHPERNPLFDERIDLGRRDRLEGLALGHPAIVRAM
jgi:hypothetical protein